MTHVCHLSDPWPTGHPLPPVKPERLTGPAVGAFVLYAPKVPKDPGILGADYYAPRVVRVLERSYVWSPGELPARWRVSPLRLDRHRGRPRRLPPRRRRRRRPEAPARRRASRHHLCPEGALMTFLIGLLLFLASIFGLPFEVWEDGSGYVDVVPPTETRWCGASWGAYDSPGDGLYFGCFEYPAIDESFAHVELPTA